MASESNPVAITNIHTIPESCKKEIVLSADQENYFANNINDFTCEFEVIRREFDVAHKQRFFSLLLFMVFVTVNIIEQVYYGRDISALFNIVTFAFAIAFFDMARKWVDSPIDRYNKKVKSDVFPVMFKYFGNEFIYSRSCPSKIKKMTKFESFPYYNTENICNYMRGTYNNTEIEIVDFKIARDSSNSNEIMLQDILLLFTPKKTLSGRIIIESTNQDLPIPRGMQVVHLEDPRFSLFFNVYAYDQIEARMLLTTSFMERLINLRKITVLNQVDCSFHSGELLIRVPIQHNYFHVQPVSQAVDFRREFKTITDDIQSIFDIIDGFQLGLDIGL